MNYNYGARTIDCREGRNLPHWTCDDAIYHITARLHDSIPVQRLSAWKAERESIIEQAKLQNRELTEHEIKRLAYLYSDNVEKYLDLSYGSCCLRNSRVAEVVCEGIEFYNNKKYLLHTYCVMPNHIHLIVAPMVGFKIEKVIIDLLRYTGKQANQILNSSGSFWQREPYDHIIRSEKEYCHQVRYVYNNPKKAGLKNWNWRKLYIDL